MRGLSIHDAATARDVPLAHRQTYRPPNPATIERPNGTARRRGAGPPRDLVGADFKDGGGTITREQYDAEYRDA